MDDFGFSGGNGATSIDASAFPTTIKYNAKESSWHKRVQVGEEAQWQQFEFAVGTRVAIDLFNFKKGYTQIVKGQAPSLVFAKWQDPMPKKPNDQHKPAFEVNVLFKQKDLGYCVFSSQALTMLRQMAELMQGYQNEKPNDTQVPICELAEYKDVPTQHGPVIVPVFKIVKYQDRPEKMVVIPVVEQEAQPEKQKASKPVVEHKEEFDDDLDKAFADNDGDVDEF